MRGGGVHKVRMVRWGCNDARGWDFARGFEWCVAFGWRRGVGGMVQGEHSAGGWNDAVGDDAWFEVVHGIVMLQ